MSATNTVYGKLIKARKKFRSSGKDKSGYNEFSKFAYFQLSDFLYDALEAFDEAGLCGVVSFASDLATLSIVDIENGNFIVITSPMSTAKLTACHEVQNLGAVETYLRRYLWSAAMELIEADPVDASPPAPQSLVKKPEVPVRPKSAAPERPISTKGDEVIWRDVTLDEKEKKSTKGGKPFWKCSFDNGQHTNVFNDKDAEHLVEGNEYSVAVRADTTGKYWNFAGIVEKELTTKLSEPKPGTNISQWEDEVTGCEETSEGSGKWKLRFFKENDDGWTRDQEVAIDAVSAEEHSATVRVTGARNKSGELWIKSIEEVEEEDANPA